MCSTIMKAQKIHECITSLVVKGKSVLTCRQLFLMYFQLELSFSIYLIDYVHLAAISPRAQGSIQVKAVVCKRACAMCRRLVWCNGRRG